MDDDWIREGLHANEPVPAASTGGLEALWKEGLNRRRVRDRMRAVVGVTIFATVVVAVSVVAVQYRNETSQTSIASGTSATTAAADCPATLETTSTRFAPPATATDVGPGGPPPAVSSVTSISVPASVTADSTFRVQLNTSGDPSRIMIGREFRLVCRDSGATVYRLFVGASGGPPSVYSPNENIATTDEGVLGVTSVELRAPAHLGTSAYQLCLGSTTSVCTDFHLAN